MKENQVNELAERGTFLGKHIHGKVEETHISWVILSKRHAFKIKKPLKLSFLDFSTLRLRKNNCIREVELNSRFTDIYQDVVPIRTAKQQLLIGSGTGRTIEYAVQMRRLMVGKRMDNLLRSKKVHKKNIKALAAVTASFHKEAEKLKVPFNLSQSRETFNDIYLIRDFVLDHLGLSYAKIIDRSIHWSNNFLKSHAPRIQQRIDRGFKRDVHGDLHSGNIFLYQNPVLFDCIEFNDTYRQIDVLYEVAFLCMDLEAFQQGKLAKFFLSAYTQKFNCFEVKEDQKIFIYYKSLRANVRAKVHAISAKQIEDQQKLKEHVVETKKYLSLMKSYMKLK